MNQISFSPFLFFFHFWLLGFPFLGLILWQYFYVLTNNIHKSFSAFTAKSQKTVCSVKLWGKSQIQTVLYLIYGAELKLLSSEKSLGLILI